MARFNSFRPPTRAVRALCELTGLSQTDCADLIRAVAARMPLIQWISPIAVPLAAFWGDAVGFFNGVEWTAPQGVANINDAVVAINAFQGGQVVAPVPGSNIPHLSIADVEPGNINTVVNFADVHLLIRAFQGHEYPFGPADANGNCP